MAVERERLVMGRFLLTDDALALSDATFARQFELQCEGLLRDIKELLETDVLAWAVTQRTKYQEERGDAVH